MSTQTDEHDEGIYVRVPFSMVSIDHAIQRPADLKRVDRIAKAWDPMRAKTPKAIPNGDGDLRVVKYNGERVLRGTGTVHLPDEQHTYLAAEQAGLDSLVMQFFPNATKKQAGRIFKDQDVDKRKVHGEIKAQVAINIEDPEWSRIKDITDALGWDWEIVLNRVTTIEYIAIKHPTKASRTMLRRVGDFVNEVWADQPERFRADVLKAVFDFFLKYTDHPNYDRKRLVRIASQHEIADLLVQARNDADNTPKFRKPNTWKSLRNRLVDLHDKGYAAKLRPVDD